jgi:hypothetical protein
MLVPNAQSDFIVRNNYLGVEVTRKFCYWTYYLIRFRIGYWIGPNRRSMIMVKWRTYVALKWLARGSLWSEMWFHEPNKMVWIVVAADNNRSRNWCNSTILMRYLNDNTLLVGWIIFHFTRPRFHYFFRLILMTFFSKFEAYLLTDHV